MGKEQELRLAKAARDEWMERWRVAELRVESVWDLALDAARTRVGHHTPRCIDKCLQCWIYDELGSMMRRDAGNYKPVKERARERCAELEAACRLPTAERRAYVAGLRDLLSSVEKMLADRE